MTDLTDVIARAWARRDDWDKGAVDRTLSSLLSRLQPAILQWDWDCGERWATVWYPEANGSIIIRSDCPLAIALAPLKREIQDCLGRLEVVWVRSWDAPEYTAHFEVLEKLGWPVEHELDPRLFSIADLWYVTI